MEKIDKAYTELETKVIKQIGGFLNYETLEENLCDNATAFWFNEIKGIEKKQLRGVISSLEKKKLICSDDVNDDPMFRVTNKGLKEYYRLFE